MFSPDSCSREIKSLDAEISRLATQTKNLKQQKKRAEERLLDYLKRNHLESYSGYRKADLEKKFLVKKYIKEKEKKENAFRLFRETGIPDPEDFWRRYKQTQKPKVTDEDL
jgi:hypothetical protein